MSYFKSAVEQGRQLEEKWNLLLSEYKKSYPQEVEALQSRLDGTLDGIEDFLLSMNIGDKGVSQATRQDNGAIFNQMMECVPNLMAGGADLWNSNQMSDQGHRIFDRNHYNGRVIRACGRDSVLPLLPWIRMAIPEAVLAILHCLDLTLTVYLKRCKDM